MKIKMLKTGEVVEYDNAYAVRLIEQGKAVKAEEPQEGKAEKPASKK